MKIGRVKGEVHEVCEGLKIRGRALASHGGEDSVASKIVESFSQECFPCVSQIRAICCSRRPRDTQA